MSNNIHHASLRHNICNAALLSIALLVILLAYVSYIQIIESYNLTFNPLNRRTAQASLRVERGRITDSQGKVLAYSELTSQQEYQREYPYGAIFSHIIGYDSSKYGKTGIESAFDSYLSGQINPERRLGAVSQLFKSGAGNNVMLSIDARLQETAYQALGINRGAIVALSPRTGAILAMVSKPGFDPYSIDTDWNSISQAANSPLLNRATQGLYPPGSIIKVLVAEAALSEQIASDKTVFSCTGALKIGPDYTLQESNRIAHGQINLEEALAVSCNITFGQLALELGRNRMAKNFDRYGFTRSISSEMQESAVQLPDFSRLSDGDLAQTGIGQGSLLVTPLRMAMLVATFANNGTTMKPYFVQKVTAPDGAVITETTPEKWLTPVDPKLAGIVSRMMITVVKEGTGSAAYISGIPVAGKTGTAENPHGSPHAWFIGFAPADNPQVAVAVIVENAGSGGSIAAPIARQILTQALR